MCDEACHGTKLCFELVIVISSYSSYWSKIARLFTEVSKDTNTLQC